MGPIYDLGKLSYIPVDEKKKTENSDGEIESEVSELSVSLKEATYEWKKNNMHDMDLVNKQTTIFKRIQIDEGYKDKH